MKRSLGLLAIIALSTTSVRGEEAVTLTPGTKSVKATIGEEVFTVFYHGKDRPKPYFLPVTAPGALAALQDNLDKELEPGSLGRQVYVCSEQATLKVEGKGVGTASLGEVLTVEKVNLPWLWVAEKKGWIHTRDVAPLAGTVTRLIDDNPSKTRDRRDPAYYDHPHHKGLWISVDEVDDIQFWAEKGRIENQSVEIVTAQGNPAVLKYVNHWLGEGGKPVLVEETTVALYPDRLMVFDIHFRPAGAEVTFRDTKEGMFAIRLPNSMREFVSGGPVTNAEGVQGTKELWGKPSPWIDYVGKIDGHEFGVTIMDHPSNPRPSRYHVRDYGLFALNPFGAKAYTNGAVEDPPLTLKAGEGGVRFKYALLVHDGSTSKEAIAAAYNRFTTR